MASSDTLILIPARMASARLPGKPLADIAGLPMIVRVMRRAEESEAGPVVVLEAATMGIPCVGTAVGHLAEWHPEAALAVGVGDFRALSAAVRQLAHDETLRLRLGQAAQQRAVREDAQQQPQHRRQPIPAAGGGRDQELAPPEPQPPRYIRRQRFRAGFPDAAAAAGHPGHAFPAI